VIPLATGFHLTVVHFHYQLQFHETMTCKQPGGACDKKFHADTFEEIAAQS